LVRDAVTVRAPFAVDQEASVPVQEDDVMDGDEEEERLRGDVSL
jgi:hypothetical protein